MAKLTNYAHVEESFYRRCLTKAPATNSFCAQKALEAKLNRRCYQQIDKRILMLESPHEILEYH